MKKIESFETMLKNGKLVKIRQAQIDDAKKLLKTVIEYVSQSEFIPKLENEINLTIEEEKEWINQFLKYDNSLLLVAEYENNIIGNIDLTGNQRKVMQHTAGMGMLNEWRNVGLGTVFMSTIIEWAKNNPILELIWLQVYTENKLGLGLYHKMGFIESGVIEKFFKHSDKYYDNLTMTLKVK